jgi:hypothetical protein
MYIIIFSSIERIYQLAMKYLIAPFILSLFLVGCKPVSQGQNVKGLLDWDNGDLRLLDTIDTVEPDQDLIAVYTRMNNQAFQIRLDFLDLITLLDKDIYIPLDTNPGGADPIKTNNNGAFACDINWDYLIKIPASGNIEVINDQLIPIPGVELFIVVDSSQDMMVISFNKSAFPIYFGKTKMQVIITPSYQNVVSDKSEPFSIDAPSPSRAKVIFAFWNTFTSVTPAQTLRSWAGAHSGPMSSRHGLRYLLDAAAQTKSPVFLLDLLTPDNLSALDYINATGRGRILAEQGVLALPDVGTIMELIRSEDNSQISQINNQNSDMGFYKIWKIPTNMNSVSGMNNLDFILLMNNLLKMNNIYINLISYGYAQLTKINNNCELLPFFTNSTAGNQVSDISLACKILLLSYAVSHPTTPLILGGDFSKSILGDPTLSNYIFSYINSHPWIQIVSINDFMTSSELLIPSPNPYQEHALAINDTTQNAHSSGNPYVTDTQNMVHDALLQSPKNNLTDLAWKVFFDLTHSASPELLTLQANYIGQIGYILAGANWAEKPVSMITCGSDLDYDGKTECIFANDSIFAIIEPDGGYVPFVFAKDSKGIHQIIGPTWEFAVGLSDPSSWNKTLGPRGDSAQYLGAFQDSFNNWQSYTVDINNNKVEMYSQALNLKKSITLLPHSLRIDIQTLPQFHSISFIPMVIDPWFRYTPGWGNLYMVKNEQFNTLLGIKSGELVEISATNPLRVFSFDDTHSALYFPEDPNFDYSQGHYLPFPMSVAEINGAGNYSVDIIINP